MAIKSESMDTLDSWILEASMSSTLFHKVLPGHVLTSWSPPIFTVSWCFIDATNKLFCKTWPTLFQSEQTLLAYLGWYGDSKVGGVHSSKCQLQPQLNSASLFIRYRILLLSMDDSNSKFKFKTSLISVAAKEWVHPSNRKWCHPWDQQTVCSLQQELGHSLLIIS